MNLWAKILGARVHTHARTHIHTMEAMLKNSEAVLLFLNRINFLLSPVKVLRTGLLEPCIQASLLETCIALK